jgi:hypothetical protein
VNRSVSLLATFVILVGCAIQALASLLYLAPLLILQGGGSVSAFTTEQLQALALMFLKLNGLGVCRLNSLSTLSGNYALEFSVSDILVKRYENGRSRQAN